MSQRRGPKDNVINPAELVPFSESLDKDPKAGMTMDRDSAVVVQPLETTTTAPLDKRYEKEAHNLRIKQWKEGPFACGFTEASWDEEYAKYKNHPREVCAAMVDNDETSPCGCCSAIACRMIGANRVGNMSIVKQSTEWVEEEQEDEHGELKTRRFTRPRLDIVVGPVRTCT